MVLDDIEAGCPAAAAVVCKPDDPVHPDHTTTPRRQQQGMEEPAWAAVLRLGAMTRVARAQVLSDVDVLAQPEGKTS